MSVGVKPYGCCRYNHGLIDCILHLRSAHQFGLDEIERVRLGVLSGGALLVADPIAQKRNPTNTVDAQFSAPFGAAAALVFGSGGIEVYTADRIGDARVRELMARTDCYRDPSLDALYPREWPAAAEIHLRDGRILSTRIEFASGEPENPVAREALVAKFVSLATDSVADPKALAQRILEIDRASDLRGLLEA
jgi:2-methylcitrate dehydratase PrpD